MHRVTQIQKQTLTIPSGAKTSGIVKVGQFRLFELEVPVMNGTMGLVGQSAYTSAHKTAPATGAFQNVVSATGVDLVSLTPTSGAARRFGPEALDGLAGADWVRFVASSAQAGPRTLKLNGKD